MTAEPRQLPLQLEHRPALGRDAFMISAGNAATVARVLDWQGWPQRRLALTGPARSGKTHLAHVWMYASGAVRAEAGTLDTGGAERLARTGAVVVEDVDLIAEAPSPAEAERALLHLHNLLGAEGGFLLLTGRRAPARWTIGLPDLASRLQAMAVVGIGEPDDSLLASIVLKLAADRRVSVTPEAVHYLVRRMDRSVAEAERVVAALDRRSLAVKRPVTRATAAALLAERGRTDEAEPGD